MDGGITGDVGVVSEICCVFIEEEYFEGSEPLEDVDDIVLTEMLVDGASMSDGIEWYFDDGLVEEVMLG